MSEFDPNDIIEPLNWPMQHASTCSDCTHHQYESIVVGVAVEVRYERGSPQPHPNDIADALGSALPKEMWWQHREDEWGVWSLPYRDAHSESGVSQ